MAQDYERKPKHTEAVIKLAMIRILAARQAGKTYTLSGPIEKEAARRVDSVNLAASNVLGQARSTRLPP